jgi:hypothetical protein
MTRGTTLMEMEMEMEMLIDVDEPRTPTEQWHEA